MTNRSARVLRTTSNVNWKWTHLRDAQIVMFQELFVILIRSSTTPKTATMLSPRKATTLIFFRDFSFRYLLSTFEIEQWKLLTIKWRITWKAGVTRNAPEGYGEELKILQGEMRSNCKSPLYERSFAFIANQSIVLTCHENKNVQFPRIFKRTSWVCSDFSSFADSLLKFL